MEPGGLVLRDGSHVALYTNQGFKAEAKPPSQTRDFAAKMSKKNSVALFLET